MGLLAGLAGLCAAAGITLTILGFTATPATPVGGRPLRRWRHLLGSRLDCSHRNRLLTALGAGVGVLLVSGWPVAALAGAAGTYLLPRLLSGREARQRIARLEALEQWARRLAEMMGASRGLEQTLADSLRVAPGPIQGPVGRLAERLNNRATTDHALRAFASDLDDPVGDLIATALILAAKRRGPGTREALAALADAVAHDVRGRREVEAERAPLRTSLLVIVICVVTLTLLLVASGTLATPYGTPLGQFVLAAVTGLYAAGFAWLKRLSIIPGGSRLLTSTDPRAGREGLW